MYKESVLESKVPCSSSQVITIIIIIIIIIIIAVVVVNPVRIRSCLSKKMKGLLILIGLTKEIITCEELHATLDPKIDFIVMTYNVRVLPFLLQRT
jgi:uncharacterized membrane protein